MNHLYNPNSQRQFNVNRQSQTLKPNNGQHQFWTTPIPTQFACNGQSYNQTQFADNRPLPLLNKLIGHFQYSNPNTIVQAQYNCQTRYNNPIPNTIPSRMQWQTRYNNPQYNSHQYNHNLNISATRIQSQPEYNHNQDSWQTIPIQSQPKQSCQLMQTQTNRNRDRNRERNRNPTKSLV